MTARALIESHRAAGRRFEAAGIGSFVREHGEGEPVVLMHGVPVSSYLWRKVLPELAERGLRGVAFDLPGLGLAERPEDADYTWGGLARWSAAAVDELGIDRYHLVVHDLGGPVGFELAGAQPDRIRSLTVLNTWIAAGSFHRPWMMHPFSIPVIGELWLRSLNRIALRALFNQSGVTRGTVPAAEIDVHYHLLKTGDGGRAFLKIMRGFELSDEKERSLVEGVADHKYPAQVVWGERDPAIGPEHRAAIERALRLRGSTLLEAKHFVPEEAPAEIADAVAAIATG